MQAAALVSAYPIIAVALFDNRLALARSLGATHIVNSREQDAESEIRKIVGPQGVDVAVDNTGNVKVIEAAYRVTSTRGRTVLVGVSKSCGDLYVAATFRNACWLAWRRSVARAMISSQLLFAS